MQLHQCQNCGNNWPEDALREIKALEQRVAPGESMPSGECPECMDCKAKDLLRFDSEEESHV
jgi:hypothetical protein